MSTNDENAATARNNSASLRRALSILLHLGEESTPQGTTLGELSGQLELNKSTLLRLLTPLCEARLVTQNPDTGRYRLGWRTAQLGQTYLEHLDLRGTAHDVLQELTGDTGETTHLVIADLPDVVYVDKVDTPRSVRMYSRIGTRQSAYCTGVGKALLACSRDEQAVRDVVTGGMPARTPNTRTTEATLRADLDAIRERGYAVDDVENEVDIRCVAAPVFDHTGAATCAVSISGPAGRITPERVPDLARSVMASAVEISRRLGARG